MFLGYECKKTKTMGGIKTFTLITTFLLTPILLIPASGENIPSLSYVNDGALVIESDDLIWVEDVTNSVKIGKFAGNRQLAFGVKNILEEYLQENGKDLTPSASNKIKVEIVYLDVLTTKKNISVFHKNEEEVVVRMKGTLYKDGKKIKEVLVEEGSSEISMSTLIVDEGGKFNQTSLSNAIKRASGSIITKLFE
jgi:hypothetical protein